MIHDMLISCNSAVQIMLEIVEAYHARQVAVYFVKLRDRPMKLFEKAGIPRLVGRDHLYRKVSEAIETIEKDKMQREPVLIQ